jgi:integral membrane protein
MAKSIQLLRIVGLTEAWSFLALLLIAMPLKYFFDRPHAVSIVGMAHGVMFLLLLLCVAAAWAKGLSNRLATYAVIAAFIPTGPFWIDGRLKAAQHAAETPPT